MKHRIFTLIIMVFIVLQGYAQLSIEDCYEKAELNYPLIKQYGLIEKSKDYNLSNTGKGYLPQIEFSAKATYQSEVIKIPINIPNIKGLSKEQYGATIDINQTIWDGGNIKSQKDNITSQAVVDKKNLEVSIYSIRQRINQLFFGILLYDEMLKQNMLYQEDLKRNLDQISAYMQSGIANRADMDAVEVEQIKAKQKRTELEYGKKAYLEMLSVFVNEQIDENIQLRKPTSKDLYLTNNKRPELEMYDAQLHNLDVQRNEVNATLMPKLSAFVTGGYGRPGLNMLKNKFSAYYIGGVSLSWNLSSLYTRKNKLNNIEISKSMIESQRETFLFDNRLDMSQSKIDIEKIRQILKSDDNIIRLRGSVKNSAEAKVANGTLSVLELMKEVNAEQQAIQDKIVHEIELIQAIYNLKYITNN